MKIVFWGALCMIFFVYAGYPLALVILGKFRTRLTRHLEDFLPSISLTIAAYNEEKVIAEKLENSFALDYPSEKLQIVVASDGSTDGTNAIVESFADRGVTVFALTPRGGKIKALNRVIPQTRGDILILSDANAMYRPDAIRKLVRHFVDPTVGAVSGDVRLVNAADSFAKSEGLYYRYERWLQELESRIGSIIGADGAMYALRREIFQAPPDFTVVDDFVISMSVARQGYRVLYDAEAIALEEGTASGPEEFRRKVRIVAGGMQALKLGLGVPKITQPLLGFCYLFHKFFRWLIPVFLLIAFVSAGFLLNEGFLYQSAFVGQIVCYILALSYAGGLFNRVNGTWLGVPYYFCMVNAAALLGLWKGIFGSQAVTWRRSTR